jgi:AraC-like DNA-binding protein
MFEKTLCLFTGSLGLILFLLMVFRLKNNRNINSYLIIILLLSSVRFLVYGLLTSLPLLLPYHKQINYSFALCVWPLLYLYFKNLSQAKASFKNIDLLHFAAPISIMCIIWFKNNLNSEVYSLGLEIGMIFSLSAGVIYAIVSYTFLKKNVWNRKSDILIINQQNKVIKQWTQFLFALIIVLFFKYLLNLAMNNDLLWFKNQNQYIWVGAFIWIIIYLKMLYSPEIIYGYQEFQNKISEYKKNAIVFDHVWLSTSKEVLNIQDAALKDKIKGNIQHYIIEIERFAINSDLFLFENFKIDDLANKLRVPKSHVLYLFKYHSTISFVDFKKIIRIQKAIVLIEEGFLKTNTIEALAAQTGFSSYSTFFKSFKSIAGSSPQEFIKN